MATKGSNEFDDADNVFYDEAAAWCVKKERGLSTEENVELSERIEENPQLAEKIEEYETARKISLRLPKDVAMDMLGDLPKTPHSNSFSWRAYAVAAIIIIGLSLGVLQLYYHDFSDNTVVADTPAISAPTTIRLPDNSLMRLNTGATYEVGYTSDFRIIKLEDGEAHFTVMKDPERPFLVWVDSIMVRAVGTAFNVWRGDQRIEITVTEGVISIHDSLEASAADVDEPGILKNELNRPRKNTVSQGQKAEILVAVEDEQPDIIILDTTEREMEQSLSWQQSLLTFGGDTLQAIAENFERKTGYVLVIADPDLLDFRIGGRFPSDDVFAFLDILEQGYGITWKQREDGAFILGE